MKFFGETHINFTGFRNKAFILSGVVILAGRTLNTDESSFGIVIFQAESEKAARQVVNNDPAVRQRVMRAELYPYRIALMAQTR